MGIRFILCLLALALTLPSFAVAEDSEFSKQMDAYLAKEDNIEKIGEALTKHFQNKRVRDSQQQAQAEEKEREQQFANPVKIDAGKSPTKGKADAKITIIEFSDFQCPYCSRATDTLNEVVKMYPNDVKVAFKHLPLGFHQQAMPAARATMAANEQGKFWEMHDKLFQKQNELGDPLYFNLAKEIGLDVEKFKADYASGKYDEAIKADMELARQNGIGGTPGFFINGVKLSGARPASDFKAIIDRLLQKK